MANTLTNLIPDLYAALDVVSRELTGLIPAVSRDSSAERAAKDQVVRSFITPTVTAADITPAQIAPNTGDQTITNTTISITKSRSVPIRWNGEEVLGINSGAGYNAILRDQFAQAIRTLTNEVETDLSTLSASATGGTVTADDSSLLFNASLKDAAAAHKLLQDAGAPRGDVQLVIDTATGAALRSLTQLTNVNEAGDNRMLRQGVLLDLYGMEIRESAELLPTTGSSTLPMAFSKSAIHLVTRAPAIHPMGDSADDSMVISDPQSGLSFDIRFYKEYHQLHIEVGLAWGFAMIKPAHVVNLRDVA